MKAFPISSPRSVLDHGMDLRDYFAAKAMQSIVAKWTADDLTTKQMAKAAYVCADAMMKAREEQR